MKCQNQKKHPSPYQNSTVRTILSASGLPQAIHRSTRLRDLCRMVQTWTRAIQTERDYLAALQADQVINIGNVAPRSPQVSGMMNSVDRIQAAVEALLNGTRPANNIQPLQWHP